MKEAFQSADRIVGLLVAVTVLWLAVFLLLAYEAFFG